MCSPEETVLSGSNFIFNHNFATSVSDFPLGDNKGWQTDVTGPFTGPNIVYVMTFAMCFDNPP